MKRVVTVTTVYTITGRDRWIEYLEVVAGNYGAHGPRIAESLRRTGRSKMENREPDSGPDSAITTHAVEVLPDDPKPDDSWPPLACSRANCHEPRWTPTDHLCAAHAQEAQDAVNAQRPKGVSYFNCTPCEDGDKTPVGLKCNVCGAKGRAEI